MGTLAIWPSSWTELGVFLRSLYHHVLYDCVNSFLCGLALLQLLRCVALPCIFLAFIRSRIGFLGFSNMEIHISACVQLFNIVNSIPSR